jgi:Cu-Zn family superoxide dismutase
MLPNTNMIFIIPVFIIILTIIHPNNVSCNDHDSPITSAMRTGLGPVSSEIGGIEHEIEGQVFPSPAVSGAGTGIGQLLNQLPVSKLAGASPLTGIGTVTAHVDMIGDANYFPNIMGHITLTQVAKGPVMISGSIRNLPRIGLIGMHFHENAAVPGNCEVVGEHFNPLHMRHGGENNLIRHIGDEGNIIVNGAPNHGTAHVAKADFMISLKTGVINSVVGRALVIHYRTDDLGKGLNRESGKSGNSGEKIACGTVTLHR